MGQLRPFHSCIPTGVHGPTCIVWANLTPCSLQGYDNETDVGNSLQGVERTAVFVVTKLGENRASAAEVVASFRESLAKLGTDYVDLFLIHNPRSGRLRRGNFVILPPIFSFIWRIPIGTTHESDE